MPEAPAPEGRRQPEAGPLERGQRPSKGYIEPWGIAHFLREGRISYEHGQKIMRDRICGGRQGEQEGKIAAVKKGRRALHACSWRQEKVLCVHADALSV
jgi:hypothetical protein